MGVSAIDGTQLYRDTIKRIQELERINSNLAAEVDAQRQREHALSDAYLRLRRLIGPRAFDTPHGPTGEQVWATTEAALVEVMAEVDRMRPVVEAALHWYSGAGNWSVRLAETCATYEGLVDVLLLCTRCKQPIKARINTPNWLRVEWIGPFGECLRCFQEAKESPGGN